jgi:hypothetical protein
MSAHLTRRSVTRGICLAAALPMLAGFAACGNGSTPGVTTTPTPSLVSLVVSQDSVVVPRNGTVRLVARTRLSDGSGEDITGTATWSSSDTQVVTVQAGTITSVGIGSAMITVSYGGMSRVVPVVARRNMGLGGVVTLNGIYLCRCFDCDISTSPLLDGAFLRMEQAWDWSTGIRTLKFGSTSSRLGEVDPGTHTLAVRILNSFECQDLSASSAAESYVEIRDLDTGELLDRQSLAGQTLTVPTGASGSLTWSLVVGVFK